MLLAPDTPGADLAAERVEVAVDQRVLLQVLRVGKGLAALLALVLALASG